MCLGGVMSIVGLIMHVCDWQSARARQRQNTVGIQAQSAAETINALTKLYKTILGASQGMQLILLGVVLILIGGAIAGVGDLL